MMGYAPQPQTGIEIRMNCRETIGDGVISEREITISGINDRTTAEEISCMIKQSSEVIASTPIRCE